MANIKLNSENLATEINRRLNYILPIFEEFDIIIKNLIISSNKVIEYSDAFMENFAKIDFAKIDKLLEEALKEFYQLLESIEEDKRNDYTYFIEKYSTHLEKSMPYITNDIKVFLTFWIPYNIRFFGLNKHNYRDNKYKVYINDLNLFHLYMNQLINERLSEDEALEIVWNQFDRRNTHATPTKISDTKKERKANIKPKNLNSIQQIILGNIANDIKNDIGITSAIMIAAKKNYKGRKTTYSESIIWKWIEKLKRGELKDEKLAVFFKTHQM